VSQRGWQIWVTPYGGVYRSYSFVPADDPQHGDSWHERRGDALARDMDHAREIKRNRLRWLNATPDSEETPAEPQK
jgi:hypothetical protein